MLRRKWNVVVDSGDGAENNFSIIKTILIKFEYSEEKKIKDGSDIRDGVFQCINAHYSCILQLISFKIFIHNQNV